MRTYKNSLEINILHGTHSDVLEKVIKNHAEKLIVIQANNVTDKEFDCLSENIEHIAMSMRELLTVDAEQKVISQIVEAFTQIPVAKSLLLRENIMKINSQKSVILSGEWLLASQVTELAGFSSRNPSAQPNRWKNKGLIFAIRHGGSDYYPSYALSPEEGYRPYKEVSKIINIFENKKNSWELAFWFHSENSWLGGLKPKDLLASDPDSVILAALKEQKELLNG